jgi:hypothetical protein
VNIYNPLVAHNDIHERKGDVKKGQKYNYSYYFKYEKVLFAQEEYIKLHILILNKRFQTIL